jgi:hypothetical protein
LRDKIQGKTQNMLEIIELVFEWMHERVKLVKHFGVYIKHGLFNILFAALE